MILKLTDEIRQALQDQSGGPVPLEDDQTQKRYVVVDHDLHQRAMQALVEQEDLAAIGRGIDDMEAGRVVSLEEADARMRERMGFPPRTS